MEKEISKEIKRLTELVPEDRKGAARELIRNLAFTSVLLKDLQKQLMEVGIKEKYKNGENQFGFKESVEHKSYNQNIKNFVALVKTFNALLPASEQLDPDSEFDKIAGNYK